jgi:hypothetical protein
VVTYSVTKGPSALCIQVPGRTWPDRGRRAGGAPDYWKDVAPDHTGIEDQELIASRLAASPPAWKPGTTPMYHALT